MQLAYELGILEDEVLTWPVERFENWIAFLRIQSKETKKASEKGKHK